MIEPFEDRTSYFCRQAIAGDLTALGTVVERFAPVLEQSARYHAKGHLARMIDPDDLLQDVWTIAIPRLNDITPRDGRVTPVLLAFLKRTLLQQLKTLQRRAIRQLRQGDGSVVTTSSLPSQELPAEISGAITRALHNETATKVRLAIAELPEIDQHIIILRGIEQQCNKDVAMLLKLEPNTVAKRYSRALERLRTKLPDSVFAEID